MPDDEQRHAARAAASGRRRSAAAARASPVASSSLTSASLTAELKSERSAGGPVTWTPRARSRSSAARADRRSSAERGRASSSRARRPSSRPRRCARRAPAPRAGRTAASVWTTSGDRRGLAVRRQTMRAWSAPVRPPASPVDEERGRWSPPGKRVARRWSTRPVCDADGSTISSFVTCGSLRPSGAKTRRGRSQSASTASCRRRVPTSAAKRANRTHPTNERLGSQEPRPVDSRR